VQLIELKPIVERVHFDKIGLKVLIADDHSLIREGIITLLRFQTAFKAVLSEAEDGAEVLRLMSQDEYDIVILDIQMPRMDGLRTLEILRQKNDNTPVLILSFHNDDALIHQAMKLGASGFLSKGTKLENLIIAIQEIQKGGTFFECNSAFKKKHSNERSTTLSKREIQVVSLIVREFSNNEIAEEMNISVRTVEFHKANITSKWQVKNNIGIAMYAIKNRIV
jgi:DNA-binding NarL/FixJ family response regulator